MKKYFVFFSLACLTVSCAHHTPSHQEMSFRNPSSDVESFPVNAELIGKMIKNGKVGNCTVALEAIGEDKMKLILNQQGATYYSPKAQDHVKGPAFSRTVEVDLSKSFGTNTFASDDYAGTLQLNGSSTVLMFDTRTKAVYRLIDFNKTDGQMDCLTAARPK